MKKIENLLKSASINQAPKDFSLVVMEKVYAAEQAEKTEVDSLETILKNQKSIQLGSDFSAQIMQKIQSPAKPKPLIGTWAWVAMVAVSLVIVTFGTGSEEGFGFSFPRTFAISISGVPPLYAASILAVGILLLLDSLLWKRVFKGRG